MITLPAPSPAPDPESMQSSGQAETVVGALMAWTYPLGLPRGRLCERHTLMTSPRQGPPPRHQSPYDGLTTYGLRPRTVPGAASTEPPVTIWTRASHQSPVTALSELVRSSGPHKQLVTALRRLSAHVSEQNGTSSMPWVAGIPGPADVSVPRTTKRATSPRPRAEWDPSKSRVAHAADSPGADSDVSMTRTLASPRWASA